MTWSRTDYLSSVQMDDLFLDIIYIHRTYIWPPFQTDDLFPNIISIICTNYILCTESLHLNGLFIPPTNDSPYDWPPKLMTPPTNDSTLRIYIWGIFINKLMTWSWTDYPFSVPTDDLFPDRIYILRMNGWPPFQTDYLFPNRISILCMNYYDFSWSIKTYVYY